MLTIAISIYNYNAFSLAERLHYLCKKENIIFEILCYDDGSTNIKTLENNKKINQLEHGNFIFENKNMGLSFARNWLLKKAKFETVLFLDADMMPENDDFIKKYLPFLNSNFAVIFGGIAYKENTDISMQLRYVFGINREAIPVEIRARKPYKLVLYSNTLLNKNRLNKILFNENLKTYGYEDLVFTKELKTANLKISHIHNPALHNHEDTSEKYILKTENATRNLAKLYQNKILFHTDSSIIKAFEFLKKYKLVYFFIFFYRMIKPQIFKNLISKKPSLFWFDIYKLGYFTSENL